MRITPIILIGLGLWGVIAPQALTTLGDVNGCIVAMVIILLGCYTLWRSRARR